MVGDFNGKTRMMNNSPVVGLFGDEIMIMAKGSYISVKLAILQ